MHSVYIDVQDCFEITGNRLLWSLIAKVMRIAEEHALPSIPIYLNKTVLQFGLNGLCFSEEKSIFLMEIVQ